MTIFLVAAWFVRMLLSRSSGDDVRMAPSLLGTWLAHFDILPYLLVCVCLQDKELEGARGALRQAQEALATAHSGLKV